MMDSLVTEVARAIIAEADHLTALDQAIGDGDHGLNMKRGMEAVLLDLPKLASATPGEMLKAAGMQLVMKVGGASGPLFGTLAMELGKNLPVNPSRADFAKAFALAVAAVAARGKSEKGQKTMLDVLYPVQEALSEGRSAAEIKAVALAAAEATIPMQATRGRASFLGERSIGHMDPGSRSSALIIATLCDQLGRKA
jgi:phosphoenolpyruvate---glycerone phosphotransferase subunit DhaL